MAKAQGYNTDFLLKRATAYGLPPAGDYYRIPVISSGYGKKRGNVADPQAGLGRDPRYLLPDVNEVSGDIQVPVDLRYIGFFLTGVFGNPVTAADGGVYTHTFKSGANSLPDYALETAHKGPGKYDLSLGTMMNTITFNHQNGGGGANATVALIGKSSTPYNASQGGAPIELTRARASNFHGVIHKGGVKLGDINSASLSYSNNFDVYREVGGSADIASIGLGEASITGSLSTRFSNRDLIDLAEASTPLDLDFIYEINAALKLIISVHQAMLDLPAPPIDGPGGYGADFAFTGIRNAVAGCAVTVELINDQPGAIYVPV